MDSKWARPGFEVASKLVLTAGVVFSRGQGAVYKKPPRGIAREFTNRYIYIYMYMAEAANSSSQALATHAIKGVWPFVFLLTALRVDVTAELLVYVVLSVSTSLGLGRLKMYYQCVFEHRDRLS